LVPILTVWSASGSLRYYILKPTLVNQVIRLISGEHLEQERDRAAVIREAQRRRGERATG